MKKIVLPFLILLITVTSCETRGDVEPNNTYEKVSTLDVDDYPVEEEAEILVDESSTERISDSLSVIFDALNNEYVELKKRFDSEKNKYYTFKYEYRGIYEINSQTWYFDSLFNVMYYEQDFGAEGGYESRVFQKYTHSNYSFYFHQEGVMDDLETVIVSLGSEGGITKSVQLDPYINKEAPYTIPEQENLWMDYKTHLTALTRKDFRYIDSNYIYDYYETTKSEYGGTESVGFSIKIDSLLIEHLDF